MLSLLVRILTINIFLILLGSLAYPVNPVGVWLEPATAYVWDDVVAHVELAAGDHDNAVIQRINFIQDLQGFQLSNDWQINAKQASLAMKVFGVGDVQFPGLEISYLINGAEHTQQTEPITFQVKPRSPPQLHGLKALFAIASSSLLGWYILLALVLAILLFLLWRSRKSNSKPDAHDMALPLDEQLQQLLSKADTHITKQRYVPACDQLTYFVRYYLECVEHIKALEATTYELKPMLSSKQHKQAILDWLAHADQVKFAQANVDTEKLRSMLQQCQQWLTQLQLQADDISPA